MGLLDLVTGGKSSDASEAQKAALAQILAVQTPTAQSLSLPELEQYAVAMNMTPAQMQAFLQEQNAYNDLNIDQTGTAAQQAALSRLAQVAEGGAEGSPTQQAQVAQINQDAARNLAGQRGAIDQQAQARGVSPGMLQAALQSQRAGEDLQAAHMASLQAQGQNYQQALAAMAQGGALGGQLQGQQNTQANQVAAAQNAMQQFNAANQQNASANNAGFQQQANAQNTQNANQTAAANTGLANQRTQYNAQIPQQMFNNQFNKANAAAGQYGNIANLATGQGQQEAGLLSGLIGTGATIAGGMFGGPAGAAAGSQMGGQFGPPASANTMQYRPGGQNYNNMARGGIAGYNRGGMPGCAEGAIVPGEPIVPGDSAQNDTIDISVSPGEAIIPRSQVQQNPMEVMRLLNGGQAPQEPSPSDIKLLLLALQQLRGGSNAL